jgi:catechol 2,3-dioxygenase-like lactoylglutathione lyase family enzyme
MKSHVGHLQLNIKPENQGFYAELFGFLGWQTLYQEEGAIIGLGNEGQLSLWFATATSDAANDHDAPGLNHIGVSVATQADVDAAVAYLRGKGVELLYGTPCNRPEYTSSEDELYYSAMFDSPDKILIEIVYTGPKSA